VELLDGHLERAGAGPYAGRRLGKGRRHGSVERDVALDLLHHLVDVALSTVTATRYTKNVLFYEGPTTQSFSPTVFVDIDAVLNDKVQALCAHESQVRKTNIEGLTIVDIIRSSAHFRGIQGRVRNAEGFVPLRLFINIGA